VGASLRFGPNGGVVESPRSISMIGTMVRDTPTANWRWVRATYLYYDAAAQACPSDSRKASPLRYLTSIAENVQSPTGQIRNMPATQFEYGELAPRWDSTTTLPIGGGRAGQAGDFAGTTRDLMDLDADGRLDAVEITTLTTGGGFVQCAMKFYRGLPDGTLGPPEVTGLPTLPWRNGTSPDPAFKERCTLNGQFYTRFVTWSPGGATCEQQVSSSLGYQFIDYNNDGTIDLLTNAWLPEGTKRATVIYKDDEPKEDACDVADDLTHWDAQANACVCDTGLSRSPGGDCEAPN
jgi:hypothetical protein